MKGNDPFEQPKVLASRSSLSSEMLMGSIMDVLKLTFKPVDSVKVLMIDFRKRGCLVSPSRIIRVSSAYWMIRKSLLDSRGIGNLSRPKSLPLFIRDWRKSAAETKRRGERGSPCLTPLKQLKVFPGDPYRRTTEVAEEKIRLIHCSHFCPKPFFFHNC